MEFEFFIGIDVSKNELDFAVMQGKALLFHREAGNTPEAVKAFLKELGKQAGFALGKAVFCMEHTGIYNNHLLGCLYKKKANICPEAASQIKSSLGNVRGKNDKTDAIRIAGYAYKNRESLRLWAPKRAILRQLAHLSAIRSRLVEAKKTLQTPLKETAAFLDKSTVKNNDSVCKQTLKAIGADLKKTDKAMDKLIGADPS